MKKIKKERVLLYNFTDEAFLQRLLATLAELKIDAKILDASAHHEKVGYLLGLSGFAADSEPVEPFTFAGPVAILHNIKDKRLDQLLLRLHEAELAIPYKAVVTPMNRFWKLSRLCRNMEKEHGIMVRMQQDAAQKAMQKD